MNSIDPRAIWLYEKYQTESSNNTDSKDLNTLYKFLNKRDNPNLYSLEQYPAFKRLKKEKRIMLFKIKDINGKTVGYILPTIHEVQDKSLKKFCLKTLKSISKSHKVWLEAELGVRTFAQGPPQDGIDAALYQYAKGFSKKIGGIESDEFRESVFPTQNSVDKTKLDKTKSKEPVKKTPKDASLIELGNSMMTIYEELWKLGEFELFEYLYQKMDKHEASSLSNTMDIRNQEMARVIDEELKKAVNGNTNRTQKQFFSMGSAHLFKGKKAVPVQDYLSRKGWTIVQATRSKKQN